MQSTDWLLAGARLWGVEAGPAPGTLLLPKLVPSCRRLMWRMTAVALKACCNGRQAVRHQQGDLRLSDDAHPPFAFGKVFPHLPADGLVDVLAESRVSGDPERLETHLIRRYTTDWTHADTAAATRGGGHEPPARPEAHRWLTQAAARPPRPR